MQLTETLSKVYYFANLSDLQLTELANACTLRELKPGERVVKKGQHVSALCIVENGEIRIVNELFGDKVQEIDTIREKALFGEQFIFSYSKARYSYYANEIHTKIYELTYDALELFYKKFPDVQDEIKKTIIYKHIRDFINSGIETYDITDEALFNIVQESFIKDLKKDEVLTFAEEKEENLFIVLDGVLEGRKPVTPNIVSKTYPGGDVLGFLTAGIGKAITFNINAATEASVLCIPKMEVMLLLFEQQGFEDTLDSVISKIQVEEKEEQKEEQKEERYIVPEHEEVEEEFVYKKPLLIKLGVFPELRQQSNMDCGVACIANVCKYFGKNVSMNKLREMAKVGQQGASMLNLLRTINTLGFQGTPMLATYESLQKQEYPSIVNWKGYHWIVVYKMTDDQIVVGDPAGGIVKYTKEEFIEGWTRYTIYIEPTKKIKEIEESRPSIKQFIEYFKPYKKNIFELFLASIAIQIFNLFIPLFSKFIIDTVIIQQNLQYLSIAIYAILTITIISALMGYFRQRLILFVSIRTNTQMISDFLKRVLTLPVPFFEARKTGDTTSRFQENEKITDFMTNTGMQVFLDVITAMLYLGLMFYFNVGLTIVIFVFVLIQIGLYYYISPKLRSIYREVFQKYAASNSYLIESLRGISTVKTLGVENRTRWNWEDLQIKYTNSYFRTIIYGISISLSNTLINHLSEVSVLFYGALLVLQNNLSIGELIAFTIMAKGLTQPIMGLTNAWNVFQESMNSVERLNDVLENEPESKESDKQEKVSIPVIRGYIRFDNVTFRYEPDSKNNILQTINLETNPGERIAFIGRSGSGKSTLIKLLYKFYNPTDGDIYVDGFNLQDIYLPSLRSQIGMVPQENDLFAGTIRENICHGKPEAKLSEAIEAAKLACAHSFINTFPNGYETHLEEGGKNLSGGQRQRIAIARTFIQKPRILILDEATSALDNESERKIQTNIEENFKDCTIFIIAHRLSTVRNVDKIYVLDKGIIVEEGTHQELIKQHGLYYYLANQQLSL